MNEEQIISTWANSLAQLTPPPYLQQVILLNFWPESKSVDRDGLVQYLSGKGEQFFPILDAAPDLYGKKYTSLDELLQPENLGILRNLLLISWFHEEKIISTSGDFNLDLWKKEAYISASISQCLAKRLSLKNEVDVFTLVFLKDVYQLPLCRFFPKLFEALMKMDVRQRLKPAEQEKILGAYPGDLSAWVLERWGFPESFTLPLKKFSSENTEIVLEKMIFFSRYIAEFFLNFERHLHYSEVENLFQLLFNQTSREFQELLVETIRFLSKQAVYAGYPELADLTVMDLLQDHLNVFDQKLLTYHDLINEAFKSQRKIARQNKEIQQLKTQIDRQYIRDFTTGLYNHLYFQEFLNQKIKEAYRYEFPLTLILFDLDNFQAFNRENGYHSGNEILKQISDIVRKNIRQSDFFARFGADEFALILPYTGLPQSKSVAKKIKDVITNYKFKTEDQTIDFPITVSVAYISILPDKSYLQDNKLVNFVLKALKQCQRSGGNSVVEASA